MNVVDIASQYAICSCISRNEMNQKVLCKVFLCLLQLA